MFFVSKRKYQELKELYCYEQNYRYRTEDEIIKLLKIIINANKIEMTTEQEKYVDELIREYTKKYGDDIIN